jgi:hypothetical protein
MGRGQDDEGMKRTAGAAEFEAITEKRGLRAVCLRVKAGSIARSGGQAGQREADDETVGLDRL